MSTQPWSAIDDGYLRAYQWAGALAGGVPLPTEAVTIPLGPGEVAHARFTPVGCRATSARRASTTARSSWSAARSASR